MNRDLRPPGEGAAAPLRRTARHHQQRQSTIKDQQLQPNGASRHVGGYAQAWRRGFCNGALDALRCAARRTDDPEVWVMLSRLADEYTLVVGDD